MVEDRKRKKLHAGDRVRHVRGGCTGTLDHIQPDPWVNWAMVCWDNDEGPGMRTPDGLSFVAIELLDRME